MHSLQYPLVLAKHQMFNECKFQLELYPLTVHTIEIEAGTYQNVYELIEQLDQQMAAALNGGSASLDADGMVVLQADFLFRIITEHTGDNAVTYLPLLDILGFSIDSAYPLLSFYKAQSQPKNCFLKSNFKNISPLGERLLSHHASGLYGQSKVVGLGFELFFDVAITNLNQTQYEHLLAFVITVMDGRTFSVFDNDETFLVTLDTQSLNGTNSIFKRSYINAEYWSAKLKLRLEEA